MSALLPAGARGCGRDLRTAAVVRRCRVTWQVLIALLIAGCTEAQELVERIRPVPETPHERYAALLEDSGLHETALGRDWLAAAGSALRSPVAVSLPFRERAYFADFEAGAASWSFSASRGDQIRITLQLEDTATFAVFADLFEAPADTSRELTRRAWSDSLALSITHNARSDSRYILRVQPELLRTGSVTVTIERGPSLAFPVNGRDTRAIQSFFGADRDGGRRVHHGVDIFAPRGTPVLAAVDGVIRSTRPNNLGGIVVWLRDDEGGQSLYYAHLDSQIVARGQRVSVGDTLGFVGNTGNARTTPPHLHFGIYQSGSGPVDPLPFIREGVPETRSVVDGSALGTWVRTRGAEATVYQDPSRNPNPPRQLARGTPLRVLAASTTMLRVRLPDGSIGYIPPRSIEPAERPLGSELLAAGTQLLEAPTPLAPAVAAAGSEPVDVLGRFGAYALVRTVERAGWVAVETTEAEVE